MLIREKFKFAKSNYEIFGFWTTFKMSLLYLLSRFLAEPPKDKFDNKYGVSTLDQLSLSELGIEDPYSIHYAPTHERVMKHVLNNLDIHYPDYTFVDLGCGKGRAVLMAMRYPFKQVVGVDISSVSCTIAQKNVEIFKKKGLQQCNNTVIRCENAVNFQIPDTNAVFYFYRPFTGPLFEQVLNNIQEAGKSGSHHYLIAYSCLTTDVFKLITAQKLFNKLKDYGTIHLEHSWSLWEYRDPVQI